jgi:hypothetical protein
MNRRLNPTRGKASGDREDEEKRRKEEEEEVVTKKVS